MAQDPDSEAHFGAPRVLQEKSIVVLRTARQAFGRLAAFLFFLAFKDLQKKLWGAGSGEVLSSDASMALAFCGLTSR
jgi:hypothetical protein